MKIVHQKSWSYTIRDIWCVTNVIVIFHFSLAIFCPFIPLTEKKIKIKKNSLETSPSWSDDVWFLRYDAWWRDGWKQWHVEVGALPKKLKKTNTVVNAGPPDTEYLYYQLQVEGVTLKGSLLLANIS